MGKNKKLIQLSIFSFVLIVVLYTLAGNIFDDKERPPAVGDQALTFELESLEGGNIGLASYEDQPIVINFWGTFCPPCVEETPALQRLYEKYNDQGVVILGINLGEKPVVRVEHVNTK